MEVHVKRSVILMPQQIMIVILIVQKVNKAANIANTNRTAAICVVKEFLFLMLMLVATMLADHVMFYEKRQEQFIYFVFTLVCRIAE